MLCLLYLLKKTPVLPKPLVGLTDLPDHILWYSVSLCVSNHEDRGSLSLPGR